MIKKEENKLTKTEKVVCWILLAIPPVVIIATAVGVALWGYYVGYPEYVETYSNPRPFIEYMKGEMEEKVGSVFLFFAMAPFIAFGIALIITIIVQDGGKILGTWALIGVGYVGYRVAKKALQGASSTTSSPGTKKALVTGIAIGAATGVAASVAVSALKKKRQNL